MSLLLNPVPSTIYQQCYTAKSTLPPIKYHQPLTLVRRGVEHQPPREFPVEPLGPQRKLQSEPRGAVCGIGYKAYYRDKLLEPKPIVGSLSPQEVKTTQPSPKDITRKPIRRRFTPQKGKVFQTKYGPIDSDTIDALVRRVRWTSHTKNACEEAALPIPEANIPDTTLEERADAVRLWGLKYEPVPDEWQRAVLWDCLQPRGTVTHTDLEERTHSTPEKLLLRRFKMERNLDKKRVNTGKIRQLIREENLSNIYVRPCPGYAGYVPRSPPEEESMVRRSGSECMVSTMKATYRKLPDDEYQTRQHARKGPLSKTITLTYPFNPYNKVQKSS